MSLKDFREALLEQILNFLWRQWSALGVFGTAGAEEDWILDPEPLLVFSLEIARYEPRLFDEILSWLWTNGHRLDAARIRKILLDGRSENTARVAGGALHFIAETALSRKWKSVIELGRERFLVDSKDHPPEALFRLKSGEPHPLAGERDADVRFARFGLNRPMIKSISQGLEVSINTQANIRFLLRSLFGVGARSESILYLLTHEAGHPTMIADATGYFRLSIRDALEELADSKMIMPRRSGRRVEYWMPQKRWWDFISYARVEERAKPKWVHWVDVYAALAQLWRTVDAAAGEELSEYMTASRLQDSLEVLRREFSRAGVEVPRLPVAGAPPDLHQKATLELLSEILGSERGEP